MADLSQLLKRLEAVTGRLEDLSSRAAPGGRAAAAAGKSAASATSAGDSASSPSLDAFDELLAADSYKTFIALAAKLGGLVAEQVSLFERAVQAERSLLVTATKSKKPEAAAMNDLLQPISAVLGKIAELRDKNRSSPLFNHLSAVSEGCPALGWVAIEPKPAPYVGEMKEAAQFYVNRVIKEFKDKDKQHVDWANAFSAFLLELHAFVKKWHTTGLMWNSAGGDAKAAAAAAPSASPAKPAAAVVAPQQSSDKPASAALFGELNKGGDITSGLKKVDKSQMTHKNPALRAGSVVKAEEKAPAPGIASSASGKQASRGPAKLALEGNKWCVENQEGNRNIVIDQTELKHLVYVYGCNNCTITVKGKVNAVTIDNCKKTGVVVDNVLASLDVVNCKSLQLQITGKAPTAIIDKTDGLNLFLSRDCLDIEVFTAKSSELNVSIPGKTDGDDYVERPVPEQFKTVIKDGQAVTSIVEHHG